MASRVLQKLLHNHGQTILPHVSVNEPALCTVFLARGLKNKLLFKKNKKRKMKVRDGKEYTVDHLYWDRYFQENPEILKEREAMNLKSTKAAGKRPLSPKKIFDTLTTSDRRLAYAAVFFLVSGFIAMKVTFS